MNAKKGKKQNINKIDKVYVVLDAYAETISDGDIFATLDAAKNSISRNEDGKFILTFTLEQIDSVEIKTSVLLSKSKLSTIDNVLESLNKDDDEDDEDF